MNKRTQIIIFTIAIAILVILISIILSENNLKISKEENVWLGWPIWVKPEVTIPNPDLWQE